MFNNSTETSKPSVSMSFKTWPRDSHGLYDYECTQTKNNTFKITENRKIIRKKNEIKLEDSNHEVQHDEQELGLIYLNEEKKFIMRNTVNTRMPPSENNINTLQNKIWYVVKSEDHNPVPNQEQIFVNDNDFAEINLNDIIKLGRVKYVATEIKSKNEVKSIDKSSSENQIFELIQDYELRSDKSKEDTLCKICLCEGEELDNPLVSLCLCAGTMRYIHLVCLKMWMGTKISTKENESKTIRSFNMKSFNCEICKTPYPLKFRSKRGFFDLIDYIKPQHSDYIILESLNQLKDNNNYKSIHIITLNEGENIVLGRGHDSAVRINDISVSRTHALIYYSNGKILLKDLKSKFGTLTLVQNEIEIRKDKKICLQIGRTLLEVSALSKEIKYNNASSLPVSNQTTISNKNKLYFRVEKDLKNGKDEMEID